MTLMKINKTQEEIEICKKCKNEVRYISGEIDSYVHCDECNKWDLTHTIDTIEATRTILTIEFLEINK